MPKSKVIPNGKDTLNVEQAGSLLGLGSGTVYRLAKDGRLPGVKLGDVWRFSKTGLEEWIRSEATKNVR